MSVTTQVPQVPSESQGKQRRWSPWPSRVWPLLRYAAAPGRALIAAAVAGGIGAIMLGERGIGYPITAAAVLAAIVCSGRRRPSPWDVAGAAAILALTSVAVFRSSDWLVTMCVWAAVAVSGAVLSRSWTWRGTFLGALTPVLVPVRTMRWASRGVRRLDTGRIDPARIVVVTVVTGVVVVVFSALFAAADPTFERMLDAVVPQWDPSAAAGRVALFLVVAGGALAASYLFTHRPRFDRIAHPSPSTVSRWEWIVPAASLVILFAVFVAVQITTLFGGQAHVRVTDGLTNAEYARQGFWQLLAVTALTLLVIAVVVRKAPRESVGDRAALRSALGVLCVLSLVVVASALHRMSLYEQQYGYTTLRLFVTSVEWWLGSVFVLVMVSGVRMSARWLPRAVGVGAALTVLGLAVINPDAYVAGHNVDRFASTGKIDTQYLSGLSTDAVPELDRLPEPYRSCVLPAADTSRGWRGWNLADANADRIRESDPVLACTSTP